MINNFFNIYNFIIILITTATPIGTGFRSVNVALRQQFATYANVRPIKSFKGINSRYEDIDLVMIRENTEDLYKGIEYMINPNMANGRFIALVISTTLLDISLPIPSPGINTAFIKIPLLVL